MPSEKIIHKLTVSAAILLLAALLCAAGAAEPGVIDTSDLPKGHLESETPYLHLEDITSITNTTEPDPEMNARFANISWASAGETQSYAIPIGSSASYRTNTHPAKFDLRTQHVVTPVKQQGRYGTCWAFASIASVESNAIMEGYETESTADFSEAQLAYFTYNRKGVTNGTVPARFTSMAGDDVIITSGKPYYDFGGTSYGASHTMTAGIGVSSESVLPYSWINKTIPPEKAYAENNYTVIGTHTIPTTNQEHIKDMLMHTGCGHISYCANSAYGPNPDGSWSVYNPTPIGSNHAVTLVGWDDNYPITNFDPTACPSKPGAWLIKNSWGPYSGQNGYFWISYEDQSLSTVTFYDVVPSSYFDTIYQHDGSLLGLVVWGINFDGHYHSQCANQFTADTNQWITSVSFELVNITESNAVNASVMVWNSTTQKAFKCPIVQTSEDGYYSFLLPDPIYVSAGERFGVCLSVESSPEVYIVRDRSGGSSSINYISHNLENQSYWYNYYTKKWYAIPPEEELNYHIKAYGINATQPDKSLPLTSGWNFIAVSEAPENASAAHVFKDVESSTHSPLRYNTTAKKWELIKKTDEISVLDSYYVYSDKNASVNIGNPVAISGTHEKPISKGWNAVSLASSVPYSANKFLSGIPWTNLTYANKTYVNGTDISAENDLLLPAGAAIWLNANADGTLLEVW